ncbi:MAG TPA: hypothetical protein VGG64_21845 [Pirellulales bacterium]
MDDYSTLSNSAVARADLLRSVTYPDGGVVSYEYNRQGQVTQMTDQNGTVHQYAYDLLGRPTADSVITLGTGIDGAVRRIARTYNTAGLPQNVTSYSAATGGTVANDIFYQYNGFQQLTAEYQSHSGAVNTSSTPAVQYTYADGSQNTVRLTEITYPSGNGPSYEYAGPYSDDDMLSRVTQIMDSSGPVVDYVYLGLKTFVQVEYPDPGIRYDLAFGSGSNLYAGLDNFGRVIDCRWRKVYTGADVERIQYGYDLASNRTWRHNTVAPGGNDELYTYDGLHRLADFQRGTFSGTDRTTITSQTLGQSWMLDATGNWSAFVDTDALVSANSVSQTRTHTKANEIATFAASSGSVWATPSYDAAGNMTVFPQPSAPTSSYSATYDAWNRQVEITGVAANAYDGVHRRTRKTVVGSWREYYYSSSWQVLEERVDSSTAPDRQFYWGLRYIDDLILRDRSSERLYALQDANWNVTAIIDITGTIHERYRYTAYGVPVFLDASFDVASYESSSFDWETTYAGYRFDQEVFLHDVRNRAFDPLVGVWLTCDPLTLFSPGRDIGRIGLVTPLSHRSDAAERSTAIRAVSPGVMIGLAWDSNTYLYARSSPVVFVDPSGLVVQVCCRATNISVAGAAGFMHCWIKTDTVAAGLGRIEGKTSNSCMCSKTQQTDHSKESGDCVSPSKWYGEQPTSPPGIVRVLSDCDEACVNTQLSVGKAEGRFVPFRNDCNAFVSSVLLKCCAPYTRTNSGGPGSYFIR